jgi:hypothetical protein
VISGPLDYDKVKSDLTAAGLSRRKDCRSGRVRRRWLYGCHIWRRDRPVAQGRHERRSARHGLPHVGSPSHEQRLTRCRRMELIFQHPGWSIHGQSSNEYFDSVVTANPDRRVGQKAQSWKLSANPSLMRQIFMPRSGSASKCSTDVAGCAIYPDGTLGAIHRAPV